MTFRRLYWVTEEILPTGHSRVTGVYTSIHDLIDRGLRWFAEPTPDHQFRLTLVKLDSVQDTLGSWLSPGFVGLEQGMEPFIRTGEFSDDHIAALREGLDNFVEPLLAQPAGRRGYGI